MPSDAGSARAEDDVTQHHYGFASHDAMEVQKMTTPCACCEEQKALPTGPDVCFSCWAKDRISGGDPQAYIDEVQRLHDEHVERCELCRQGIDYCVVAETRKAVLDAWNE